MTPNNTIDIQAELEQLKLSFIDKIPAYVTEIKDVWHSLKLSPQNHEQAELLHRLAHTLTGTAATFELESLAIAAREIEQLLRNFSSPPSTKLPVKEIEIVLKKLCDASALVDKNAVSNQPVYVTAEGQPISVIPNDSNNLIYIIDEDKYFTHTIKLQIQAFGYQVETFNCINLFKHALKHQDPTAVIMDAMFDNTKTAGIDYIAEINSEREIPLQTIFITESNDLKTRLSAVRANGFAYFTKPVLITSLVSALDKISYKVQESPYRVLIVDDSPTQTEYAALTLQQAGMKTREVNDPFLLLDALNEFSPDIILMDIYMPKCTGIELSQVIRQMENYMSTPIMFVSSEDNLGKKLGALSIGGDDFLTKPVKPWHLVSVVSNRALRARLMRRLAETDGLTGLLNHTKSKECLKNELDRAKRDNTPLSFAMLDLDFFKTINDNYGHPAGDRVLKSISNIFKQRLRKYDIVGRYGGEEFIVILPNTDAKTAEAIINTLRTRFSELTHYSKDKEFQCTFSGGIAAFPDFDSEKSISNAADQALYQAKQIGRNQVVIAKKKE
ncbi:diguanylate cyclase [Colwellia sp. RE-S-Sl-9]